MSVPAEEIDRRVLAFTDACTTTGTKITHQRMEVFREVARTHEHPDAESTYDGVRRRVPAISLDKVYRTLTPLERLEVVSRVCPLCARARFDALVTRHHHFLCSQCGILRDFASSEADNCESLRRSDPGAL